MNWQQWLEFLLGNGEFIKMVVPGTTNTIEAFLLRATQNIRNIAIVLGHGGFGTLKTVEAIGKVMRVMGYHVLSIRFPDEDYPDLIKPTPMSDFQELRDAAQLVRLLTGVTIVHLVGISRGGYAVLGAMGHYPEYFTKCVAFMPPIDMENYDWRIWDLLHASEELKKTARAYFAATPSPMRLAEQGFYLESAQRIYVIGGEGDPLCPPELHTIPFALKIGAKYAVIPRASHNAHNTTEGREKCMQFLGGKL